MDNFDAQVPDCLEKLCTGPLTGEAWLPSSLSTSTGGAEAWERTNFCELMLGASADILPLLQIELQSRGGDVDTLRFFEEDWRSDAQHGAGSVEGAIARSTTKRQPKLRTVFDREPSRGGEVLALPTCNSMGREEKHLIKATQDLVQTQGRSKRQLFSPTNSRNHKPLLVTRKAQAGDLAVENFMVRNRVEVFFCKQGGEATRLSRSASAQRNAQQAARGARHESAVSWSLDSLRGNVLAGFRHYKRAWRDGWELVRMLVRTARHNFTAELCVRTVGVVHTGKENNTVKLPVQTKAMTDVKAAARPPLKGLAPFTEHGLGVYPGRLIRCGAELVVPVLCSLAFVAALPGTANVNADVTG
ncbi:hypothetical protein AK812_SmicGene42318 [Symbiodinium microadriaticum]|uniref:Uncharacterized protein n=1 Tax=Symbiodinium microadriaticum TaxID=2951 RepID=A0A1Q9C3V9_SYMMI|nr:hypothetical protein AK812_SmicGene42318 [Symbiodinium microadriaticum]